MGLKKVPGYEVRFEAKNGTVYMFAPKPGKPPAAVKRLEGKTLEEIAGHKGTIGAVARDEMRLHSKPRRNEFGERLDRPGARLIILNVDTLVQEDE